MKKFVSWHSPKRYQSGWMEEAHTDPKKLPKPRSKYCKKLKGPHEYGKWERSVIGNIVADWIWERHCKACNRKDWWSAPCLEGDFFKPDITARPPGFYE